MTRYVYDFDEPSDGGRELLGGKGIGLAEMTQLGVPVPAGFTITTDACRAYIARRHEAPDGLDDEIGEHIARLEEKTGKRFGDPDDPLLVSVRSGAAISMPGMMDTILNLGLNDDAVAGLARGDRQPALRADSYRRLIQMYGEVVDGIDGHRFEQALADLKRERGVAAGRRPHGRRPRASSSRRSRRSTGRRPGDEFPQDAREQLRRAVLAVFESWDNPRAQVYRRTYGIPDDLGTAVNVVQMVFGNKGERSATGVCFTRDPSTGEQRRVRRVPRQRAGRGRRRRHPHAAADRADARDACRRRTSSCSTRWRGSSSTTATCRTSSSRSRTAGSTCCRRAPAKRTAAAAIKVRRRHGGRGPDQPRGGDRADRPGAARPAAAPDARPERDVRGRGAGPERVAGRGLREDRARRRHGGGARQGRRAGHPRPLGDDAGRHPRADPGEGRPHRARRHDLARGGRRARHGQAVRRRLRGPRASTRPRRPSRIGGHKLHEGDTITIDGGTGRVIIGEVPLVPPQINEDFETILDWADEVRRLSVRANARHAGGRERRRASSAPRASASAAPSTCSSARTGCRSCRR